MAPGTSEITTKTSSRDLGKYANKAGVQATLGARAFVERLKARGVEPGKGTGGRRVLRGIGLVEAES